MIVNIYNYKSVVSADIKRTPIVIKESQQQDKQITSTLVNCWEHSPTADVIPRLVVFKWQCPLLRELASQSRSSVAAAAAAAAANQSHASREMRDALQPVSCEY